MFNEKKDKMTKRPSNKIQKNQKEIAVRLLKPFQYQQQKPSDTITLLSKY